MRKLVLLLALTSLMAGCEKNNDGREVFYHPAAGVFVTNEGQFNQDDASLTYFNPATGQAEQEVCYRANNVPLGDGCQSMTVIDTTGFVVVTNSERIAVINTNTFEYIEQINGISAPRYVLPVSENEIYISSLYSNKITVVNPKNYQITGTIDLGGGNGIDTPRNSSEQMVKVGSDVFVCSWSYNNKIFRINTQTNEVTSLTLEHAQPNSIVADKYGKLWVASDGGYNDYAPAFFSATNRALTRINAKTFTVEESFEFPSESDSPSKLAINTAGDKIYFINNAWGAPGSAGDGVFVMSVTANALPAAPLIPMGSAIFYGLGVDPCNGDIYISDAVSYYPVGSGKAYRYSSEGELIKTFATGIFPGSFCFKP